MKSFYVTFYKEGKRVSGTFVRAETEDEAMQKAEWSLVCHLPNVEYDEVKVQ